MYAKQQNSAFPEEIRKNNANTYPRTHFLFSMQVLDVTKYIS